jgi:hypothetical protein
MTYDRPRGKLDKEKVTTSTTPDPPPTTITHPSGPLHIEKCKFDSILNPPKRTIQK